MAAYDTTIPNNVLNIINVYISNRRDDDSPLVEGYFDLIASLYSLLPNHDTELTSNAWMYGSDLKKYLSIDDIDTLMQNLPSVMRYCYNRRAGVVKASRSGMLSMPDGFIELFLLTVKPKEGATIFLPFAGDAEIALYRPDCHYSGFEIECERWAISQMVFNVCGIDADIRCCSDAKDFIESGKKFDYIFSFPPMGGKEERHVMEELIGISRNNLTYNGVMYCYLPVVFCNSQRIWVDFRKEILGSFEKYSIVNIALGSVLRPVANIGVCAFFFTKDIDQHILLLDATGEEFRAKVEEAGSKRDKLKVGHIVECLSTLDERYVWHGNVKNLKHPFNLYPGRYLVEGRLRPLKQGEKRYSIGDLVELRILQPLKGRTLPVIGMKDLSSNYFNCDVHIGEVSEAEHSQLRVLDSDSLLVGYVNGQFKVGKISGLDDRNPVALQRNIFAVKIFSTQISSDFLLRSFLSDEVVMQADVLSTGAVIKSLSERDFLDIKIVVPSREEQDRICGEDAHEKVSDAERKVREAFDMFRDDIHMKKHAIGQTTLSLISWWRVLEIAHEDGLISYNPGAIVDDEQGISVGDVFDNLYNGINQIQDQINKFDRGHRLVSSAFSLSSFIKDYIDTHKKPEFHFDFVDDSADISIIFPEEALVMILDDIVSNACSHGFGNTAKAGNAIRIESYVEGVDCIVKVSNNGDPLTTLITIEDVFTYNRTGSADKSHSGIGGYEVRNLIRQFDGDVELISNPDDEFPICYKLLFHNTKITIEDGE